MIPAELKNFFENQLSTWALARENFEALTKVKKKSFRLGDLEGYVQFNPVRAVSTLAKVDKKSLIKRKCFLCDSNRPPEQGALDIINGWKLLVNPFPILPYHFTIAGNNHVPQKFEYKTAVAIAEKLPGMVVFYNDDGAGASAPDHVHYQAVPIEALPLITAIMNNEKKGEKNISLPYKIITSISEMSSLACPMNVFIWMRDKGELKFVAIPRRKHRPSQYFLTPPDRIAVSPGAIDMAGVIVTPFEEDFLKIDDQYISDIYKQVAF